MTKKTQLRDQTIALALTVLTCGAVIAVFWSEIKLINLFTSEKISINVRLSDVLIGLTIYLKTSIDFAIFIGRLMDKNKGLKGRIGIEIGTALGNAIGTMAILLIWSVFKEVTWLLALMVIVASFVLVRLAEDGLEHIDAYDPRYPKWFKNTVLAIEHTIRFVNKFTSPIVSKIIPSKSLSVDTKKSFMTLMVASFMVPFILGLDDFAGYVPLFSVVNVFGFECFALSFSKSNNSSCKKPYNFVHG
jgi:hypothetical protein